MRSYDARLYVVHYNGQTYNTKSRCIILNHASSADACPKFHWAVTLGSAKRVFGAGRWFKASLGFIQEWINVGSFMSLRSVLMSEARGDASLREYVKNLVQRRLSTILGR